MRVSDQDYVRSCVAKERQLAHLLGHPKVEECYESAGVLWDNAQALPRWTRDWVACGPLIAHYAIAIHFEPLPGQTPIGQATLGGTTVHFSDHPNRESALMFGIVKEVIRLLEHPHASQSIGTHA